MPPQVCCMYVSPDIFYKSWLRQEILSQGMKASWEVSSHAQLCDRAPHKGNMVGIAIRSGRAQHLDASVLCIVLHFRMLFNSDTQSHGYCVNPGMTLPTGLTGRANITLHLDSKPQQFIKQTVPGWKRAATAANDAMNTINMPCYSFPALLAITDTMPA